MFTLARGLMTVLSWVPLSGLHFLSDISAFLVGKIIRYRYQTITNNLRKCFPEWDENKIAEVRWQFYRHFVDVLFEIMKTPSFTEEELKKHCRFHGPNAFQESYRRGKNVAGFAYHLGNWEWFAMSTNFCSDHEFITVYKPLSDPKMDAWVRRTRGRFGQVLLSFKKIREYVEKAQRLFVMGLASDQRPHHVETAIEVSFFGHRTLFFPGPSLMVVKNGWDGISGTLQKDSRSHYSWTSSYVVASPVDSEKEAAQIERLCRVHQLTNDQAIQCIGLTQTYANVLEACIRKQPHIWLWSHRRWKD